MRIIWLIRPILSTIPLPQGGSPRFVQTRKKRSLFAVHAVVGALRGGFLLVGMARNWCLITIAAVTSLSSETSPFLVESRHYENFAD